MSQSSTNIYDTFGNEVSYTVAQDTLVQYLKNSTVNFPLPEASSDILQNLLGENQVINPYELETVETRLVNSGYGKPAARAMAAILIQVAKDQGVDPMTYFEPGPAALKLTVDAYEAMNALRPNGNRVGFRAPLNNATTKYSNVIKP